MIEISEDDIIRCEIAFRNPFTVEHMPLLARLHKAAFSQRRRLSKRFIGKPAKRIYRLALALGMQGIGRIGIDTPAGARSVGFNARNTQFGALYLPQVKPIYEPETSALLDRLVADDDVFVDVGANWGWYSLLIATRQSFRGSVHAFEPFPQTFKDLSRMVAEAGLGDRIQCHDIALADKDGEASMGCSDGVQSGLARLGEAGGCKVKTVRLDSLGLPAPSVIKIDAEDHELEVLAGATGTIDTARPFIVYENWRHAERPELTTAPTTLLARRNYRFFFPGWTRGDQDCVLPDPGNSTILTMVPFLPSQRFQLPAQINIVAVPVERMEEFRRRFA